MQEYWRFDPTGELFRPPEYGVCVLGQELGPDGAARSAVLGLEVCEVGGRLRFRDRQGRCLRSHTEAEQAAQRAERARHESEAEVDRLRTLLASATGERAPSRAPRENHSLRASLEVSGL